MAFCVHCGQQVLEGAGFCPGCGAPVATQVGSGARAVSQSAAPPARKKSKALPIVIAVAVVAVIAIAIAALALINPFGSKDNSDGASGGDGSADILEQTAVPPIENVGDRVEFGIWRDEPITWRVLAIESGRALLVTENILTIRQYDDLDTGSADQIDYGTGAGAWAESGIRAWLNGEFLNAAFTRDEQNDIDLSHLTNLDAVVNYETWNRVVDDMELILNNAYAIYESGDVEAGRSRVDDAFFDYYEALGFQQTVMAHISGDRAADVEYQFSFTKRAMGEGRSEDARAFIDTLISLLREDADTLDGNADIKDRVFLLSIEEVKRYFLNDSDRLANITMTEEDIQYILRFGNNYWGLDQKDLANAESELRGDYLGQNVAHWWWLRSQGRDDSSSAYVLGDGSVISGGGVVVDGFGGGSNGFGGIRPALWVKL
jgi:hypothetical protein